MTEFERPRADRLEEYLLGNSTLNTKRKPPRIKHKGKRPENWEALIDEMAEKTYMPKRQVRLLKYYAGRTNGFRPSLALIEKETGISANKVSEVRLELVLHGVLSYGRENPVILIHWNRIMALASIPDNCRKKDVRLYPPTWAEEHYDLPYTAWYRELRKIYEQYASHLIWPNWTAYVRFAYELEQKRLENEQETDRILLELAGNKTDDSFEYTQAMHDIMLGDATPLPF